MPEPRLSGLPAPASSGAAQDDDAARSGRGPQNAGCTADADARKSVSPWTVAVRRPDGREAAAWTYTETGAAMHQFARLASREFGQTLGVDASVAVMDRQRRESAVAVATTPDERELRFADPAAQDLYRQVNRERQMALNEAQLENRITVLAPDERRPPGRDGTAARDSEDPDTRQDGKTASRTGPDPRQVIESLLDKRDPATTAGSRDRRRLDGEILDRAAPDDLKRIAGLAEAGDLDAVRQAIEAARGQTETQVGPEPGAATRRADPPLEERFTRDDGLAHTNWWFREAPDRLAFQERWLSMRTATHSPAAILAMVDRAEEKGWRRMFVEGSAEFRREVWIHAAARDITVVGYTPTRGDREAAQRERQAPDPSLVPQKEATPPTLAAPARIAPAPKARAVRDPRPYDRASPPLTRETEVLLQKAFRDSKVPASLQAELRAAVGAELAQRLSRGEMTQPRATVYDVKAPRQRSVANSRTPASPEAVRSNRDRSR